MEGFTDRENKLFIENRGPYILTKAYRFFVSSPEEYRRGDALNMPDVTWSSRDLELVKLGCQQLMEGKGLTPENPLNKLGVRGCHLLFGLFHFSMASQYASSLEPGKFLDKMVFQHIMDGSNIIYYNLVDKSN